MSKNNNPLKEELEKQLELRNQELKDYQEIIRDYDQDLQYIGERLTEEIQKRLPGKAVEKLIQDLNESTQTNRKGEAIDALVTTTFTVIQDSEKAFDRTLEVVKEENRALKEKIKELKKQLSETEEAATELERELGGSTGSIAKQTPEQRITRQRLRQLQGSVSDNTPSKFNQQDLTTRELIQKESRLKALEQENNNLKRQLANIQKKILSQESESQALENKKTDKNLEITKKETNKVTMTGDATCLNNTSFMDPTTIVIDNIIKMIPVFNGEPADRAEANLQIFLNISQAYFKTLSSADQQIFLSMVPKLKLRGIPYEICNNKSFTTFEEFQKNLSEYYFPSKSLSGLTHDLQSCRQLNGETARQFGQRIQIKLNECEIFLGDLCKQGPQLILEEYQQIAIQTFRRGLVSQSLKQYACMLDEKTLAGIIKKVSDLETLENQCHTPVGYTPQIEIKPILPQAVTMQQITPPIFAQNILPQTNTQTMRNDNLNMGSNAFAPNRSRERNNQFEPRGQNYNNPQGGRMQNERRQDWDSGYVRRPIVCFRCGQSNHISRECRSPRVYCQNCRSTNHDTRVCSNKNLHRTEVRRLQPPENCEFCQRYGHNLEECAAKRQWEARQQNFENQGNGQLPAAGSNGRQ